MSTPSDAPVEGTGVAQEPQVGSGVDEAEQLVFTLRVATGQIVKLEKVDSAGKRREVPMDEAVELAGKDTMKGVEAALDDAFEAGIISMLEPEGAAEESDGSDETGEDLQLRRELLTLIIGTEVRRRLLRRLAGRLILSKKIESRG